MHRKDIFQIVERFRCHSEAEDRAAALFDGLVPRATVQALSASALVWAAAARLLEVSLPEETLDEPAGG